MKKTTIKAFLAAGLLAGSILGQVGSVSAATSKPTAAPVMKDNLSKYGLVKDVELPVTAEAGGMSYTLEKIMIYDTKSETAQALIKKYGYTGTEDQKYFIWTKLTFENKSGNTIQFGSRDLNQKWMFYFDNDKFAYSIMPAKKAELLNNTDALWTWSLKPGQKLTSYQAFTYSGDFKDFFVIIRNKGVSGGINMVVLDK